MGLLLGASVVTFVELIDLVLNHCSSKYCNRKKEPKPDYDDESDSGHQEGRTGSTPDNRHRFQGDDIGNGIPPFYLGGYQNHTRGHMEPHGYSDGNRNGRHKNHGRS